MANYRNDRYARPNNGQASRGPKRNSPFVGFVAIVPGKSIRLEASAEPTKFTAANVEELVARIDQVAAETGKEATCFWLPLGKREGCKPELLHGIGGAPYIRFSDPAYVPQQRERAKITRITD